MARVYFLLLLLVVVSTLVAAFLFVAFDFLPPPYLAARLSIKESACCALDSCLCLIISSKLLEPETKVLLQIEIIDNLHYAFAILS